MTSGCSIFYSQPVSDLILSRLPATLILMSTATVIWISIAILAGVTAAVRRYSLYDNAVTFTSYVLYALPTFWLGLMLIFVFGVTLRIFPPQGIIDARTSPAPWGTNAYWAALVANPIPNLLDIGRHLVLPVITLVAVSVAGDSRFVRSAMLDSLNQDYVRTAKAKGLPSSRGHLPPRLPQRPAADPDQHHPGDRRSSSPARSSPRRSSRWPGMGLLFYEGVNNRDYFLLMGLVLIGSVLVVVANLVADVLYAVADPRIRYD